MLSKETLDKVELISKNIRSMLITKRLEPVSTLLVTRHMQVYSTFDIRHWIFKILRSVGFVLLMVRKLDHQRWRRKGGKNTLVD